MLFFECRLGFHVVLELGEEAIKETERRDIVIIVQLVFCFLDWVPLSQENLCFDHFLEVIVHGIHLLVGLLFEV